MIHKYMCHKNYCKYYRLRTGIIKKKTHTNINYKNYLNLKSLVLNIVNKTKLLSTN